MATVFIGRRGGVVIGRWSQRPTMMNVPTEKRTQDADVSFEEVDESHADVVQFAADQAERLKPKPKPDPRLKALEDRIIALEAARTR